MSGGSGGGENGPRGGRLDPAGDGFDGTPTPPGGNGGGNGGDDRERSGPRTRRAILDRLPDPRDGLTRVERVVLWQLDRLSGERGRGHVPTVQLYGRVVEHVPDLTERELEDVLVRLGARRG